MVQKHNIDNKSGIVNHVIEKLDNFELLNKNILIAGFGRIGKKLISRLMVLIMSLEFQN